MDFDPCNLPAATFSHFCLVWQSPFSLSPPPAAAAAAAAADYRCGHKAPPFPSAPNVTEICKLNQLRGEKGKNTQSKKYYSIKAKIASRDGMLMVIMIYYISKGFGNPRVPV